MVNATINLYNLAIFPLLKEFIHYIHMYVASKYLKFIQPELNSERGMGNMGVSGLVEYFKTMNHVLHDVDQLAIITLTGL